MTVSPIFKLKPTSQQYDWGKVGLSSKVAQFVVSSKIPGPSINESSPYAELWMGTHSSSPSRILSSDELLSDYLASHQELIGKNVIEKFDAFNGNLPYLYKVLSIEKALSIQTHPDKETAEELHRQYPNIYKDPNHKPEMALAITPFRALCGFRPLPDIAKFLYSTPELVALIPPTIVTIFLSFATSPTPNGQEEKAALKNLFAGLMTANEADIKNQLSAVVNRYRTGNGIEGEDQDIINLVLRLNEQFPGDVGVFCVYMLNYIVLNPGQAIFLGAGEPHAYISGECIECMANSDNVIRAGLTPKLRDVPNLVAGLTYAAGPPTKHFVEPTPFGEYSTLYDPPIPEFSVVELNLPKEKTETQKPIGGPSIAIVTKGFGSVQTGKHSLDLGTGQVLFVGAGTEITFKAEDSNFVVHRAFVEAN